MNFTKNFVLDLRFIDLNVSGSLVYELHHSIVTFHYIQSVKHVIFENKHLQNVGIRGSRDTLCKPRSREESGNSQSVHSALLNWGIHSETIFPNLRN